MRPQCPPNQNWPMTAQFVNRAKQAALANSGARHLAPMFGPPNGGDSCPQGPPRSGGSMGPGRFLSPMASMGNQAPCTCGNNGCGGGGGGGGSCDSWHGGSGSGCGTLAFTSQLTGLPVPEHPSVAFPSVDCIMVPPGYNGSGANQMQGGCNVAPRSQQPSWQGGCSQFMGPQQAQPYHQQQQQFSFNQNSGYAGSQWPPRDNQQPPCQCGNCTGGGGMRMSNLF